MSHESRAPVVYLMGWAPGREYIPRDPVLVAAALSRPCGGGCGDRVTGKTRCDACADLHAEYTRQRRKRGWYACGKCGEPGHNSLTCPATAKRCACGRPRKVDTTYNRVRETCGAPECLSRKGKAQKCSRCGAFGHEVVTCARKTPLCACGAEVHVSHGRTRRTCGSEACVTKARSEGGARRGLWLPMSSEGPSEAAE